MEQLESEPGRTIEIEYSLFRNTVGAVVAELDELPVGGIVEVRTNDP